MTRYEQGFIKRAEELGYDGVRLFLEKVANGFPNYAEWTKQNPIDFPNDPDDVEMHKQEYELMRKKWQLAQQNATSGTFQGGQPVSHNGPGGTRPAAPSAPAPNPVAAQPQQTQRYQQPPQAATAQHVIQRPNPSNTPEVRRARTIF